MLTNFHTHSTYCDGKSTPREMILAAIDKGFCALGFSGHGYTDFDSTYCMAHTDKYLKELCELKEEFKSKIQIYIGVEEDMHHFVDRDKFDYIIGSSHYFEFEGKSVPSSVSLVAGKYQHIDSDYGCMKECIDLFGGDTIALAKSYYESFCSYIKKRKPDIVGHFDLITKFDEMEEKAFFLDDAEYRKLAVKYLESVVDTNCIFEVNTGAISRGYRSLPYPHEELLYVLKKHGALVMLNSDCHAAENIDCFFEESRKLLSDIGFEYIVYFADGGIKKDYLK